MPELRIVVRATGAVIALPEGKALVAGRSPQCDIPLEDQSVSRRHCTLEARGDSVTVTDLGSANGTYINDRQVEQAIARPGDLVRVGSSALEVRGDQALRGMETVLLDAPDRTYESVIQKRFEPTKFDWLATGTGAEASLLERAHRHLSTLHRVSELLAEARDIKGLSDATLRAILEVTAADRVALVLRRRDPGTGEAEVAAARSRDNSEATFAVSRTLVCDVIEKGVSTFAHDALSDDRFNEGQSVIQQNVRSVMCVPLRTTDEILGALYADSSSGAGRFNEAELDLLSAIGNQAGVALHRVRLMSEIERLCSTRSARSRPRSTPRTATPIVTRSASRCSPVASAKSSTCHAEELETVELSGLLHDVGKIAVPDAILNKQGQLTADEFEEMKKHPELGARILENIQNAAVKAVLPGVKHHHEKWDGTGYPDGLRGEEIPILARLLGIADFFDALTSERSYRAAMSHDEVVNLIRGPPARTSRAAGGPRRSAAPRRDVVARRLGRVTRRCVASLALAASLASLAVPGSGFRVHGSQVPGSQVPGSVTARFHHVHYRVPDPSAAMAEVAAKLGGTREVVSGLGVGVRRGDDFLLFDRMDDADAFGLTQPSLLRGYELAVEWLRSRGISVDAGGLARVAEVPPGRYHHLAFAARAFDVAVVGAGTPIERRGDSAIFDAGGGVLVELVRETDVPELFWCPMHPDVRSGTTGKCPQCGMDLVPIPPPKVGEYKMDVAVQRTARGASGVRLTIRDPESHAVVTDFETIHEKTFHLFIVSRDLEYFAHVHPERQKNGAFLLRHPLPPGEYMLIADFLPVGGTSQMLQRAIVVGVRARFSSPPERENRALTPEERENRALTPGETLVDGVRVGLKVEDMAPGKDACLTFTLTDARTGAPITDLQPFLGAPAHLLMVRGGLEDAVHAHPEELQTGGPTVSFHPLIPAAGPYKLWIQFRRGGRESTAAFVITAR